MDSEPEIRKTKKGEHRCQQHQCSHIKTGDCPVCDDCGSPAYICKDDCEKCKMCETMPNKLRSEKAKGIAIDQKEVIKMMIDELQQKLAELEAQEQAAAAEVKEETEEEKQEATVYIG